MRLLREPLVHFLLIGAAIFVVSIFVGRGNGASLSPATDKQIIVTPQKIALLRNGFVLDTGHPPTDAQVQQLIDAYIREEVFVREARAQGLDQDDSIVRRRLVQKMEFAVPDAPTPTDAELQSYLNEHSGAFRTTDGKIPALAEIHGAVLAAWMNDQRKSAVDDMYQKLRSQYQVTIQTSPSTNPSGGTP